MIRRLILVNRQSYCIIVEDAGWKDGVDGVEAGISQD